MKYILKLFLTTRASDQPPVFLQAGYRVQKFTKPAETGNCKKKQLPAILFETERANFQNRCMFRQYSKTGLEPLLITY